MSKHFISDGMPIYIVINNQRSTKLHESEGAHFKIKKIEFGLKADTTYKEPISTIQWVYSNSNSKSDKNTNVIMNHMLILNNCPCGHVCTHVNVWYLQCVTKKTTVWPKNYTIWIIQIQRNGKN